MKIFLWTLTLLIVGLVFVAPPLIAVAPMLFVGVLLMAAPLMMRGMNDGGRTDHDDAGVRNGHGPTSGRAAR